MDNNTIVAVALQVIASKIQNESSDDTSDSEDEELLLLLKTRKKHFKIMGYIQNVVLRYDAIDFKSHFRMARTSVEILCSEITANKLQVKNVGRPPFPVLDSILLTLWTLGNQESFRGIGDRFGLSRGNAHTIFMHTCKEICTLKSRYIVWPSGDALRSTVNDFNNLRGHNSFPNVLGCVDGTHIAINGPADDNSFYNRKGYHSMILQGVCNANHEFIDVFCGWPGSSHDARVWQNSPLYHKLTNNKITIPEEFHLLGDTAYPIRNFLMVPYKDNGHLTRRQKNFNKKLSSTRVVIEQTFGRLRGVFRRLKYLNLQKLKYFKYVVMAACILHNFCIKQNEIYEEGDSPPEEDIDCFHGNDDILGRNKRDVLMLRLPL